ncbi:MAG: putative fused nickel transport protein LarMN [Lachnoclostridium sp.]|jgi:cobalt/nickel transport system permease protein
MHMADALLSPAVAGGLYAASASAAAYSVKKVRLENDIKKIPLMGVMSAFIFAAQMINFTIPGTGSSGHLCGGLLLSILLGPYAGFLSMISVLIIQCLLFADGGLLALGANIWNMAFYSCFVTYMLIYRPLVKRNLKNGRIILASVLGSVISLQLGAFSVALETCLSGITALPFQKFLLFMLPVHLVIGAVEGFITAAVIIFIKNTRPDLLENCNLNNRIGYKQILVILSLVVLLMGGGLSLVASSNPDGLEWSIQKISGDVQVTPKNEHKKTIDAAGKIQKKTSVMPDYTIADSDSKAGTSLSGILGSVAVAVICLGCGFLFRFFKHKGTCENNHEGKAS